VTTNSKGQPRRAGLFALQLERSDWADTTGTKPSHHSPPLLRYPSNKATTGLHRGTPATGGSTGLAGIHRESMADRVTRLFIRNENTFLPLCTDDYAFDRLLEQRFRSLSLQRRVPIWERR
jgi:hypothetical protein